VAVVTDHELDALLDQVRADVSIAPSREFLEHVRAGAASRRRQTAAIKTMALALVGAAVLLAGFWWTAAGSRLQVPAPVVSAALQPPVGTPTDAPAALMHPRASASSNAGGSGVSVAADSAAADPTDASGADPMSRKNPMNSMDPAGRPVPAESLFTPATFEPVEMPQVPTWTVETAAAFVPVEFVAVEFPAVEFPRVAVTLVEFPVLPITPGAPAMNPGKEMR
jgi:hypothetical protein